jgi:hypothetical protein
VYLFLILCVFLLLPGVLLFPSFISDPADFARDPVLPNFYNILSTNEDKKGLPFVSSIEGIKYPFWATQWHAERTQFEWYGHTRRGNKHIARGMRWDAMASWMLLCSHLPLTTLLSCASPYGWFSCLRGFDCAGTSLRRCFTPTSVPARTRTSLTAG